MPDENQTEQGSRQGSSPNRLDGSESRMTQAQANEEGLHQVHEEGGASGGGRDGTREGGLTDQGVNPSEFPSRDSPLRVGSADPDPDH
jgi:hypothetical protein